MPIFWKADLKTQAPLQYEPDGDDGALEAAATALIWFVVFIATLVALWKWIW